MEHIPEFISNHLLLVCLFVGLLSLLIWNLFGNSISGIREISPAEATRMMNHEKAVLLDLRNDEDFNTGHILNSVNIPMADINDKTDLKDKYAERPVILTCARGAESVRAARVMKLKGLDKIFCLRGGIDAWRTANLPLVKQS